MAVVAAAAVIEVVNEVSRGRCRLMSMMSVPRGGQFVEEVDGGVRMK